MTEDERLLFWKNLPHDHIAPRNSIKPRRKALLSYLYSLIPTLLQYVMRFVL